MLYCIVWSLCLQCSMEECLYGVVLCGLGACSVAWRNVCNVLYCIVLCGLGACSVVWRSVYIMLYCIVWSWCLQCSMEECLYRVVL